MKSRNGSFWLYLLGSSDVFCKLLGAEGKVGKLLCRSSFLLYG